MTVRWIEDGTLGAPREPSLNVALGIPVSVLPPKRAVRWIGQLGALDATQNAQAKALLASWNTTDGNNCINNYGLDLSDVDPNSWGNRDGWVLSCFTNWWHANHKLPALPAPGTQNGVGWVDLDQDHLTALQLWGLSKGVVNAGQVPCATNCLAKYAADQVNLTKCLAICGTGQPPGQPPFPPPPQGCPPGQLWNVVTGQCYTPPPSCASGWHWDETQKKCMPPGSCPTGQQWDDVNKVCQPALVPPPGPTTPATTTGTSSGTGLLIIGAVVLAAVGIFAAVVSGGGGAAVPRVNPRKRKSTPSPTLVDIQCETPSGWRDFRRIAAGGINPEQMYGRDDPANKAWLLPDTIDRMHPRFHQLLQATGCVAVPVEPLRGNPKKPVPEAGYAFFYDGSAWKSASDEMWDTEMMTLDEIEGAKHVGTRSIDGTRVNVWQLRHGKPFEADIRDGHHYIAQTARG